MGEPEDDVPPPAETRQTQVIGERMAIVETKVGGVQDDLRRIGTHIHTISQEVQKISIIEGKCLEGLKSVSDTVERFEAKLETLMNDQVGRMAISDFWRKFAMILTAAAALAVLMGAIGSGLIWLSHSLKAIH